MSNGKKCRKKLDGEGSQVVQDRGRRQEAGDRGVGGGAEVLSRGWS